MKTISILFTFLYISALFSQAPVCVNDSTGYIPLNDLGTGNFFGYQGGLYPGGTNTIPNLHLKAGKKLANQIRPRNMAGAVDLENGKVVLLCLGSSVAGSTFEKFTDLYQDTITVNPCLIFANGAYGGKGLDAMVNAEDTSYWNHVFDFLDTFNVAYKQVQIVWLKNVSRTDTVITFPDQPLAVKDKFKNIAQVIKDKFPNTKLLYLTGEHYGGYVPVTNSNFKVLGEPVSYYNNWAVKWVIEDQINGDVNLSYKNPVVNAPWMAWAHYAWADGSNERMTDGYNWVCPDDYTSSTGYHLSDTGKLKEAELLYSYFAHNAVSKVWFLNGPKWSSCTDIEKEYAALQKEFHIYPNPNKGIFTIDPGNMKTGEISVSIYDHTGKIVYKTLTQNSGFSILIQAPFLRTGFYLCVVGSDGYTCTTPLIIE